MKKIGKNRLKGVAGLDVAEAVIFSLLIIGIIILASLLSLYSLGGATTNIFKAKSGTSQINESVTLNGGGIALSVNTYNGCDATITSVYNSSTNLLSSGNYSVTNCIFKNLTSNGINWNVSYSWTYTDTNYINTPINNLSNAETNFMGNSTTFFSILAVVVIIALISLIVLYVRQFRGKEVTV